MGFKISGGYSLEFGEGTALAGAHVRMRTTPVGVTRELEGHNVHDGEAMQLLVEYVREWDLEEEDGTPLPISLESLEKLDYRQLRELTRAWYNAATMVSGPKDERSNGGQPSPDSAGMELSIPMEAL